MIPHIVFEALIKHDMYCSAPAEIWFITCPPFVLQNSSHWNDHPHPVSSRP